MAVQAPSKAIKALLSGDELAAMGDIGPSELVEGRVVRMSPTMPRHGKVEYRMAAALGRAVEESKSGEVQVGEVGIYTHRNPDTVRGADVLFISQGRLAQATPGKFLDVAPEIVVEILSPDDRWSEVRKKLREYFEIGVLVVLVVDAEGQTIIAYRSPIDLHEYSGDDVLMLEDLLPGFRLRVADLFAD